MLLPYIACGLVAAGLLVQFSMHLVWFRQEAGAMKTERPWILWLVLAATLLYVVAPLFQHDKRGGFAMEKFGRVPVLLNGRIKPLDTVARNSLLIIHGKQTLAAEDGSLTPMDWLAEVMMKPEQADERKIFVIRNADTLAALGLETGRGKVFFVSANSSRICRTSSRRRRSRKRSTRNCARRFSATSSSCLSG